MDKMKKSLDERIALHWTLGPVPAHCPELGPCHDWSAWVNPRTGYPQIGDENRKTISVHRYVCQKKYGELLPGVVADHICLRKVCINEDHLRPITKAENGQNLRGCRATSRTGVRGVTEENPGRFRPYVNLNGKRYRGPLCSSLEEASIVVVEMRKQLHPYSELDKK